MKKAIRQLFSYLKLPTVAFIVAAGLVVLSDLYPDALPFEFSLAEKILVFSALFCILIVMKNHFSYVRVATSVREHLNGISEFETDIGKRLNIVSKQNDTRQLKDITARLKELENSVETVGSRAVPVAKFQPVNVNIPPENLLLDPKIVPISNFPNKRASNDRVSNNSGASTMVGRDSEPKKRFSGDLESHLEQGKLQMFLQPALLLPDRIVTHYEAFARLNLGDDRIIKCGNFLAKAEKSGTMADIDNQMLFKIIQLLRKLKRDDVEPGIFWNLSHASLASKKAFSKLTEILRANSALAPQIMVEISQANYLNLKQSQLRRFSSLREFGVRLSIDQCDDPTLLQRLIEDDLFSFIKIPIDTLIGYEGTNHELIGRRFAKHAIANGIELIATHVEKEFQVLELIDLDILMVQGHLFSKPRPIKTEGDRLANKGSFISQ